MGLMDLFKKKETLPNVSDDNLVAVCSGEMIEAKNIKDEMFSKEMLGKTIGFIQMKLLRLVMEHWKLCFQQVMHLQFV